MEYSPMIPRALTYGPEVYRAGAKLYSGTKRARHLYESYGPKARSAARTIKSAWKKYKSYKDRVKEIGRSTGMGNAKRSVGSVADVHSTRTLQQLNLVALSKTSTNEIDKRQRDLIDFVGTKVCMQMANETTDPLTVNVAVIHPKDIQTVDGSNFFRAYGTKRGQDFSVSLSGNEMHCLPINADIYTILKHYRFTLDAVEGAQNFTSTNGKSYRELSFYVPLKRQLRYVSEGDTTLAETGNVYLVWWCDKFLSAATTSPTASAMAVDVKAYKYFKETPN